MGNETQTAVLGTEPETPQNMTIREAIAVLVQVSDLDAEFAISFYNSDPIPVQNIEENTDSQVVAYGS